MHPFVRSLVIGVVGLIVAGGLITVSVLSGRTGLSLPALVAAGGITAVAGVFVFVRAWIWSLRTYRAGATGSSMGIAVAGGIMALVAALALGGLALLALTFVFD